MSDANVNFRATDDRCNEPYVHIGVDKFLPVSLVDEGASARIGCIEGGLDRISVASTRTPAMNIKKALG